MRILFLIILILQVSCKEKVPEAQPVIQMIEAFKTNNLDKFKQSFSNKILQSDQDWPKIFSSTKISFETTFGEDFSISEIVFRYDEKSKLLVVSDKEKEQFRIHVVEEDKIWKINED